MSDKPQNLSEILQEETGLQRDRNFYSGIALGTVHNRIMSVLEKYRKVEKGRMTYPITMENERILMCVIAQKAFTDVKELSEELYAKTVGIRRRYATKKGNLPHSIDNFPELEEMKRKQPLKTQQIRGCAYTQLNTDPRKEFAMLKIKGEVYRALIDRLSMSASDIAQYANSIHDPTREEVQPYLPNDEEYLDMLKQNDMLISTAVHLKKFTATLENMRQLIEESDDILLNRPDGTRTSVSIHDTMTKVARTARLCYRSSLLRRSTAEIKLKIEEDEEDVILETQEHEMQQVMLMMLLDKIYILRDVKEGQVTMGYSRNGGNSVTIYVRDNGPTIDEKDPNIILQKNRQYPVEKLINWNGFNKSELDRYLVRHSAVLEMFNTDPTGVECRLTMNIHPRT